ncbi:unnamed protein product [Schistosoma turkestanicum]|nr:unnamed protein product [Schistosoma turkestanicum]
MIELDASPKKCRWDESSGLLPASKCTIDNKPFEVDGSGGVLCINVESLSPFGRNSQPNYFSSFQPHYSMTLKDYPSDFGALPQTDCVTPNIEFLTYPHSMTDSQGNRDELSTPITITGFDNSSGISADSYLSNQFSDISQQLSITQSFYTFEQQSNSIPAPSTALTIPPNPHQHQHQQHHHCELDSSTDQLYDSNDIICHDINSMNSFIPENYHLLTKSQKQSFYDSTTTTTTSMLTDSNYFLTSTTTPTTPTTPPPTKTTMNLYCNNVKKCNHHHHDQTSLVHDSMFWLNHPDHPRPPHHHDHSQESLRHHHTADLMNTIHSHPDNYSIIINSNHNNTNTNTTNTTNNNNHASSIQMSLMIPVSIEHTNDVGCAPPAPAAPPVNNTDPMMMMMMMKSFNDQSMNQLNDMELLTNPNTVVICNDLMENLYNCNNSSTTCTTTTITTITNTNTNTTSSTVSNHHHPHLHHQCDINMTSLQVYPTIIPTNYSPTISSTSSSSSSSASAPSIVLCTETLTNIPSAGVAALQQPPLPPAAAAAAISSHGITSITSTSSILSLSNLYYTNQEYKLPIGLSFPHQQQQHHSYKSNHHIDFVSNHNSNHNNNNNINSNNNNNNHIQSNEKKCKVCGDRAVNHNFGQLTCESCKAFFRRNAHKELTCTAKSGEHVITPTTRRECPSCRLKQCFRVGMRPDLIQVRKKDGSKPRWLDKVPRAAIVHEQHLQSSESLQWLTNIDNNNNHNHTALHNSNNNNNNNNHDTDLDNTTNHITTTNNHHHNNNNSNHRIKYRLNPDKFYKNKAKELKLHLTEPQQHHNKEINNTTNNTNDSGNCLEKSIHSKRFKANAMDSMKLFTDCPYSSGAVHPQQQHPPYPPAMSPAHSLSLHQQHQPNDNEFTNCDRFNDYCVSITSNNTLLTNQSDILNHNNNNNNNNNNIPSYSMNSNHFIEKDLLINSITNHLTTDNNVSSSSSSGCMSDRISPRLMTTSTMTTNYNIPTDTVFHFNEFIHPNSSLTMNDNHEMTVNNFHSITSSTASSSSSSLSLTVPSTTAMIDTTGTLMNTTTTTTSPSSVNAMIINTRMKNNDVNIEDDEKHPATDLLFSEPQQQHHHQQQHQEHQQQKQTVNINNLDDPISQLDDLILLTNPTQLLIEQPTIDQLKSSAQILSPSLSSSSTTITTTVYNDDITKNNLIYNFLNTNSSISSTILLPTTDISHISSINNNLSEICEQSHFTTVWNNDSLIQPMKNNHSQLNEEECLTLLNNHHDLSVQQINDFSPSLLLLPSSSISLLSSSSSSSSSCSSSSSSSSSVSMKYTEIQSDNHQMINKFLQIEQNSNEMSNYMLPVEFNNHSDVLNENQSSLLLSNVPHAINITVDNTTTNNNNIQSITASLSWPNFNDQIDSNKQDLQTKKGEQVSNEIWSMYNYLLVKCVHFYL